MKCSFNFWRKNPKESQGIQLQSQGISRSPIEFHDPTIVSPIQNFEFAPNQDPARIAKETLPLVEKIVASGKARWNLYVKETKVNFWDLKKIKQVSLISRYIGITGFNLEEFHKVVSVISLWIVWSSPWNFCSRWKGARYDRDQGGRCSQLCEECFRWYSNEGEWGSSLLSLFPRYLFNICWTFVQYFLYISIALSLFPRYLSIFVEYYLDISITLLLFLRYFFNISCIYFLYISIALLLFPRYLFNTCLILLGHFHNRTILDISNQKGLESSMLPPQVSILLQ